MNDSEKSDERVAPVKSSNDAGLPAEEAMEGRRSAKGNTGGQNAPRTQSRISALSALSALDRVHQPALKERKRQFTTLLHHVTIDSLREAYLALARKAASGVDGVTWCEYGQDVEARLAELHARIHRGAYRAKPSRRVYIPKPELRTVCPRCLLADCGLAARGDHCRRATTNADVRRTRPGVLNRQRDPRAGS